MLKHRKRFISRALALVFAAGFVALVPVAAQDASRGAAGKSQVISVAAARALPAGIIVTVEGSVTVPSGAFKSGTSDEGFAIQDASGGLYVRTGANLGLRIGQRMRVSGTLVDNSGERLIAPVDASHVLARGRGMKVQAQSVSTGRIGEATEGRLVRVTGTITKPVGNDLPYGYRVFIDDGSGEVQAFVYASTGIGVNGLRSGQRIFVTGFANQYKDHYEVIPRFRSDIRRAR